MSRVPPYFFSMVTFCGYDITFAETYVALSMVTILFFIRAALILLLTRVGIRFVLMSAHGDYPALFALLSVAFWVARRYRSRIDYQV